MKRLIGLAAIAAATCAVATPAAAQRGPSYGSSQMEESRFDAAQRRFDNEYRLYQQALERYRATRNNRVDWRDPRAPDYSYNDPRDNEFYDPSRDYRDGPTYRERVLSPDDRVYRGQDGRYYCKRNDGTTGLIVGGVAGGLFGNVITNGRSRSLGTLLGAAAGAALGSSVDRNQEVRCR